MSFTTARHGVEVGDLSPVFYVVNRSCIYEVFLLTFRVSSSARNRKALEICLPGQVIHAQLPYLAGAGLFAVSGRDV